MTGSHNATFTTSAGEHCIVVGCLILEDGTHAPAPPKRKRRTKAEIKAAKAEAELAWRRSYHDCVEAQHLLDQTRRELALMTAIAKANEQDRATYEELWRQSRRNGWGDVAELEAELARCFPVVEAALAWEDDPSGRDYDLALAVDAYRAGGIV